MKSRTIHDLRIEPDFPANGSVHHNSADFRSCLPASCASPRASTVDKLGHYLTRPLQRLLPLAFATTVLAALYVGWSNRDEGHLSPETGIGYWLGIAGGTMMLLLLLYPLRKRFRLLRHMGKVPGWFRLHMFLGVLGPTLILFHSNFKLGSLNSNVALAAMLIVVASGVAGRYLYAKVHKGLYGSKAEIGEIIGDARQLREALGDDLAGAEKILALLRDLESTALSPRRGLLSSLGAFVWSGFRTRRVHVVVARQARQIISGPAARQRWTWRERRRRLKLVDNEMALYFAAVNKAARFAIFERLFALWHVLHLPMFFLLVIAAILHVVAVHFY